jgi:chemosensory pili system protein ChpB (putative protein-glutamate methylesterase)
MRIGIASLNGTQASIMFELLQPLCSTITVYDEAAMDSGVFSQSTDHLIIIDYSVDSIMDLDCINDMIARNEPKVIMSEKSLYSLQYDERLGWRNIIVSEIAKALPDLAAERNNTKTLAQDSDIWVVGASSGGPDALNKFLSALPKLPISLIIAQHIGSDSGTQSLHKVLNNRQENWTVEIAANNTQLRHGHAYIVQRDTEVSVEGDRLLSRSYQLPNQPSPSINATLRSVRRSSNINLGVIILTGMGNDGTAALNEIKHKTIKVMAQDASDCAARSMPDSARQAGVVDESDTAAGLARRLASFYGL